MDPITFNGGDVNLYQGYQNSPATVGDPSGLYTPRRAWKYLTEAQQAEWCELEERGWGLYQEGSSYNPIGEIWRKLRHSSNETVRVDVLNRRLLPRLLNGADLQWVNDGWAVDFLGKLVWLDWSSNEVAGKLWGQLTDAIYDAGKAGGWRNNNSYDVDLLGSNPQKDSINGPDKTLKSMKDNWPKHYQWLTDGAGINPANFSIRGRRVLIELWYLTNSMSFASFQSMVRDAAGGRLGIVKLILRASSIEQLDSDAHLLAAIDGSGQVP